MTKPIFKWAGRKDYLIEHIDSHITLLQDKNLLKENFNYHEPFLGSASVFLHLKSTGKLKNAYLNDNLTELIIFYESIKKSQLRTLSDYLEIESEKYNKYSTYSSKTSLYKSWNHRFNQLINPEKINRLKSDEKIEVTSLFLLLNKACFNGIYRKNLKGEFNVPHGRTYRADGKKFNSIKIPTEDELQQLANHFDKNTYLSSTSYDMALKNVKKGDLVYLDPPYYDTVNYYGINSFTKENHIELKKQMDMVIDKGANIIMSNSSSKECKALYKSDRTDIKSIPVRRTVQRKKDTAKKKYKEDIKELFITSSPLKVVELFAGVGGFRLGLEKNKKYEIVWSNNWEPSTKVQHASLVYKNRFKVTEKEHSDEDIFSIKTKDIPNHDVLVGGFPCQDYSVATTLKNSQGLIGKKGVLWWSIHRILEEKGRNRPKYLFLENVDRLLKSPANQRGRDFAVMLKSLDDLGYAVEWRVINSADYGMPQKRHRVYFLGYHKTSSIYKKISKQKPEDWILDRGVLADAFKISGSTSTSFEIKDDLDKISKKFNKGEKSSPFLNSGVMINGKVTTMKTAAIYNGKIKTLGSVLVKGEVEEEFYINNNELKNWAYLKGSKKIERTNAEGYKYFYSEGSMGFPDDITKPSRTIITGEGGPSPSRFKHVIKTKNKHRRLTPLELERLNMFPDNHTKLDGITNTKRAFFMGNALVVGVVSKISESLSKFMD
jgi:DNA (cytosine-5)-methyltransferase 1